MWARTGIRYHLSPDARRSSPLVESQSTQVITPHRISRRIALVFAGAAALFAFGCGAEAALPEASIQAAAPTQETPLSTITDDEAMIWLQAPNGNHQTGWARVWEEESSLFVEVDVSPPEAVAQPAHVHRGQCSTLGVIDYRLENIIGGHSLTEFTDMTLSDLATGGLSINLHLSFADFSTFTACGAIPVLNSSAPSASAETPDPGLGESGYGN